MLSSKFNAINTTPKITEPIPICEEAKDQFNCNTDWLSRIFGFPVTSFNIKPVGGGLSTQTYRVNITSEQEGAPTSMFAKYIVIEDAPFLARVLKHMTGLYIESLSRKEVYFYSTLQTVYRDHGILTPRSYYAALENTGRPEILNLLGFKSPLCGIILLEDLGKCQNYPLGSTIPQKYAMALSAKLAQFHSLNWHQPIHPEFPFEVTPQAYIYFFNLSPSIFDKHLSKDKVIEIINTWGPVAKFLTEPKIKDALISFSEQGSKLLKYYTNDILPSNELFQHQTFLHGDFHSGNIFFLTEPSNEDPEIQDVKDIALIDFQCYGYGHPSTEFSYFMANCVEFDPETDLLMMKIYYEELTKKISPKEYPWEVFQREVEIRFLQFMMNTFNMYKISPEMMNKVVGDFFAQKGMDIEKIRNSSIPKYYRFAHIVEKWNQENIWERI